MFLCISQLKICSFYGFGCHCILVTINLLLVGLYVCVLFIPSNVNMCTALANANAKYLPSAENCISWANPFSLMVWIIFLLYKCMTLAIEFCVNVTIYFSKGHTQKFTISSFTYIVNRIHAWFCRLFVPAPNCKLIFLSCSSSIGASLLLISYLLYKGACCSLLFL